ncbi:hypothetical protein [Rhodococcus pyridinivorans]|uniref:hypothetical protein n=1 Tax=Rhodococcus pyridinivorans TaxID=103816 RepID=UPI0013A6EAEE|nr:hypothetical protein [Rhodococcus pyridinivorans]
MSVWIGAVRWRRCQCYLVHGTPEEFARCVFGPDAVIEGNGQYALRVLCDRRIRVSLHETLDAARKLGRKPCSHPACAVGRHKLIYLDHKAGPPDCEPEYELE